MKNLTAMFLVFSLLCLSVTMYAEKRGADIAVYKKDGQQVNGELIAVKKDSILLMEKESGTDASVGIEDIKIIMVEKRSQAILGTGLGFLFGFAAPVAFTIAQGYSPDGMTLAYGYTLGPIGALLGGILGAASGIDEKIQIERKSNSEIKDILAELSKKARIPDFQ